MALNPLSRGFFDRLRRRRVAPTTTIGVPGVAIWSGHIQSNEKSGDLRSRTERYKTYSEMLVNATIVAAGTRHFLNLVAKSKWSFTPSEEDTSGEFAERLEEMLTEDPITPWHRIVRRAAMYRFYGFSIQEWTAKRRDDGVLTLADVAPRAQRTIERWDVAEDGTVLGAIQVSPQTQMDLYLPREKIMYVVDDTLNDSPEGLGLFRQLVASAQRLARYEQLEGFGFETDLRGIPIGRAPFTELAKMVEAGELSQQQRVAIEKPVRDFVQNHIKTAQTAMYLDSITYETKDEAGRPSNVRQFDVELLKGGSMSFAENAAAIERVNREMARVLGVEQLMLGSGSAGSFALAKDKTSVFFMTVDSVLAELVESVEKDLIDTLWRLNGWPDEMKPEATTEATRQTDVEEIAVALRDMATAGAVLAPDDPVITDVRDLLGVSPPPEIGEGDAALLSVTDTTRTEEETIAIDPEGEQ